MLFNCLTICLLTCTTCSYEPKNVLFLSFVHISWQQMLHSLQYVYFILSLNDISTPLLTFTTHQYNWYTLNLCAIESNVVIMLKAHTKEDSKMQRKPEVYSGRTQEAARNSCSQTGRARSLESMESVARFSLAGNPQADK